MEIKKRNKNQSIIFLIVKNQKLKLVILVGLCFIVSLLELIIPYIDKMIINDALLGLKMKLFVFLLLVSIIVTLSCKILDYVSSAVFTVFSNNLIKDIKVSLYKKMLKLPTYIFNEQKNGYIQARLNEIDSLSAFFSPGMFKIIPSVVTMLGAFIYLAILNQIIFVLMLVAVPIIFFICKKSMKAVSRLSGVVSESEAKLAGKLQENISGASEIKLLNRGDKVTEEMKEDVTELAKKTVSRNVNIFGASAKISIICAIFQVLVTFIVGMEILKLRLTLGDYVSIIKYVGYVFSPAILIANFGVTIQPALVSLHRVNDFFNGEKENDNLSGREIDNVNSLSFENVSFSYDGKKQILKNANLQINKNDKILIIGENGSGKTTALQLISSILQPEGGRILCNDISYNKYKLSSLREKIGVLSQDTYLFSGSIMQNILPENYNMSKVLNILDSPFFKEMNFKTGVIVENGKNLSSGQRQKISFARMILRNPEVIIIDEGITNLDIQAVKIIKNAMDTIFKNKICILVSHSGQFDDCVNRIVELKEGQFCEKVNN